MDKQVIIHEDEKSNDNSKNDTSYSEQIKRDIIRSIYFPEVMREIRESLKWKSLWAKISKYSDVIANILLLSSGSLASFQTIYSNKMFSIGVILCNTVVFTLNKLSSMAKTEASKLNEHTNKYMNELHINKSLPNEQI
jgi:hypothetical protein